MSSGHLRFSGRHPGSASPARGLCVLAIALVLGPLDIGLAALLPAKPDSVKFAVIGDNGTGSAAQYEVAEQMVRSRATFPFDLVLMLGDNFYGRQRPPTPLDMGGGRRPRAARTVPPRGTPVTLRSTRRRSPNITLAPI